EAGAGAVNLVSLTGGSVDDELNVDPHAFAAGTVNINLGAGDDVLSFDTTIPSTATLNFNNAHPTASLVIDGGAGNDVIHVTTGTTATGGTGNDTFVI